MTRNVGLFGITWHPQNLLALAKIANADADEDTDAEGNAKVDEGDAEANDVTVFTTETIYEDWMEPSPLDLSAYEWVLQGEDEPLGEYFRRVEAATDGLDFLMVVTPFGSGRVTANFVDFDPACPSVCWIYNARACVESTRAADARDSRDPLREVTGPLRKALVAEDPETAERTLKPYRYYVRPYVLEHYDAYLVEYPPIKEHLDRNWHWSKPVYGHFSPFVYEADGDEIESDTDPVSDADRVQVTISGRVVENVRDYEPVLSAFEDLFAEYGDDLALTVLGRPVGEYGDRVMERCSDLDREGYAVEYYPDADWIPTEEFERALARSDLLLNPIYLTEETTREPAPDEIRGTTKGTGVLMDALGHATPLLLPEGFEVAEMIRGSTLTYDSTEELRETVGRLVEERGELRELQDAAAENAEAFTVGKQRERFEEIVADVTEG